MGLLVGCSATQSTGHPAVAEAALPELGASVSLVDHSSEVSSQGSEPSLEGRFWVGIVAVRGQAPYLDPSAPEFVIVGESADLSPPLASVDGSTATPMLDQSHGTAVTGLLVGQFDGAHALSVAPGARVRVVGPPDGDGITPGELAAVVRQSVRQPSVILIAAASHFGARSEDYSAFEKLVEALPQSVFVVAAGNEGVDVDLTTVLPCALAAENLLCVGATSSDGLRAHFGSGQASSFGPSVDLFAPATDLKVLLPRATASSQLVFRVDSGTSYAAAILAGLVQLLWSAVPGACPASIIAALKRSTPLYSQSSVTDAGFEHVAVPNPVSVLTELRVERESGRACPDRTTSIGEGWDR
jgi:subtilisin family serine protease